MASVSIILPCLNEAAGLTESIPKILGIFRAHDISGEIIVVDNGSTDNSAVVAKELGARYIFEPRRGYGNAYLAGLKSATGEMLILGDPDGSYDFAEIPRFLSYLTQYDAVLGSRFLGTMKAGAMPPLHRYVGNPGLRLLLRYLHGVTTLEPSTGFIGLRREKLDVLKLREPGMEFASEVLLKIRRHDLRLIEIPIVYHPRIGTSKLRPFRDGMRNLVFMLREFINPSS